MKLFELIEPKISTADIYRSNNGLKRIQNNIANNKNSEYLGKGSYGQAVAHKARPGAVIKSGIVGDLESDGYLRYIRTLAENKYANSNPYLPRVYSIKMYKNEKGDDMYIAEIEKLSRLISSKMPAEALMAIGNKAFYDFEQNVNFGIRGANGYKQGRPQGKKSTPMDPNNSMKPDTSTFIASVAGDAIADILNQAILNQGAGLTTIKDPLLKQALMIIKKLDPEHKMNDMAIRNLMVRYGPGGAQLVITDPLM